MTFKKNSIVKNTIGSIFNSSVNNDYPQVLRFGMLKDHSNGPIWSKRCWFVGIFHAFSPCDVLIGWNFSCISSCDLKWYIDWLMESLFGHYDQYEEEALMGWIFSCISSCDFKWPIRSLFDQYDEKTLIGWKNQIYNFN